MKQATVVCVQDQREADDVMKRLGRSVARRAHCLAAVLCVLACVVCANESLEVHVTDDQMQAFFGIGFNASPPSGSGYGGASAEAKRQFCQRLTDGRFKVMRLWGAYDESAQGNIAEYVNSGFVRDIVAAGVECIMVHYIRCRAPEDHAAYYAGIMKTLHDQGMQINVVDYKNKPNTSGSGTCREAPDGVIRGILAMRAELDKRGLQDIGITGPSTVEWWPRPSPEHASKYDYAEGDDMRYLNALMERPDVVDALGAWATQTYGKGITTEMQDLVRQTGKDYWVTIAATDPPSAQYEDPILGVVSAGQCLSDLNHGATHWCQWHLGQVIPMGAIRSIARYNVLSTITHSFDTGARLRRCESSPARPTADMHFNYTQEPHIVAAAAQNPDGRFAVCLANLTGLHSQHYASTYNAADAMTYDVTVRIDELESLDTVTFSVRRYHAGDDNAADDGNVVLENGALTVAVASYDFVSLQSAPITAVRPTALRHVRPALEIRRLANGRISVRSDASKLTSVCILDARGRLLATARTQGQSACTLEATQAKGFYLVKTASGQGSAVQPLVIE